MLIVVFLAVFLPWPPADIIQVNFTWGLASIHPGRSFAEKIRYVLYSDFWHLCQTKVCICKYLAICSVIFSPTGSSCCQSYLKYIKKAYIFAVMTVGLLDGIPHFDTIYIMTYFMLCKIVLGEINSRGIFIYSSEMQSTRALDSLTLTLISCFLCVCY